MGYKDVALYALNIPQESNYENQNSDHERFCNSTMDIAIEANPYEIFPGGFNTDNYMDALKFKYQ